MNTDDVNNGIVLDHIKTGKSMDTYHYFHLEYLDCCVAIIKMSAAASWDERT